MNVKTKIRRKLRRMSIMVTSATITVVFFEDPKLFGLAMVLLVVAIVGINLLDDNLDEYFDSEGLPHCDRDIEEQ